MKLLINLISKKITTPKLGSFGYFLGQLQFAKQIGRVEIRALRNSLKLLFIIGLFICLFPTPSHAQESSPSGTIAEKINALKEEIASKAAEIKTQITQKVQNKAIIGKIISLSDTEVTIQTVNNSKIVKIDEFTEILGSGGKEIKIDTLETDDNVAALGDYDDRNNLAAQRLIYLDKFASNSAELIWGQIQKQNGSTITVKTKDGKSENITVTTQTELFLGNEEASLLDAKIEKHLLARATRNRDGSLRARFVYFIPSMGFTKPDDDASSSAKPAASTKPASPSASSKR